MAEYDFYDGYTENTVEILRRQQLYVSMALDNGDVAFIEKPGEVTIKVRLKKDKK